MATTDVQGRRIDTREAVSIRILDGVIAAIEPTDDSGDLAWIGPGLVDLQVNGYAGIDLNDDSSTAGRVAELCRSLAQVGVTSFLPTIITAAPAAIEQRVAAIAKAVETDQLSAGMIAGIHLEGPFVSPEDGARGAHPFSAVRSPDWKLFRRWQQAAGGRITIITLSPEWPKATDFIEQCRGEGVRVAIGHTAATPEQIRDAVAAGASLSTHLGNAAHPLLPRHPNYLWEQLAADDLWASFIADGFHLPPAVMKTILRMKGERAVLVSDSVALAGMPPGEYDSAIGQRVMLTSEGRLHLIADPRLLAGSAQPLLAGITQMIRLGLATPADAWAMASVRPSTFLALPERSGIAVGAPANLVLFRIDDHDGIMVDLTIVDGDVVFQMTGTEA